MADVLEVTWVLREEDGKLTHDGWKTVTRRPRHTLMVEVVDAKKGIQSDAFYARCQRMAFQMRISTLECMTALPPPSEELPSVS